MLFNSHQLFRINSDLGESVASLVDQISGASVSQSLGQLFSLAQEKDDGYLDQIACLRKAISGNDEKQTANEASSVSKTELFEKLAQIAIDYHVLLSMFEDELPCLNQMLHLSWCESEKKYVRNVVNGNGAIALHGGVGEFWVSDERTLRSVRVALQASIEAGQLFLYSEKLVAVETATRVTCLLENCDLFNAGKGAVFNEIGEHELEACIVDGETRKSGAIAAVKTVKNPIKVANEILQNGPHSLIVGSIEAEKIAKAATLEIVQNSHFSVPSRRAVWESVLQSSHTTQHPQTVGVVVMDIFGHYAAASSTGGVVNKKKGRVGDVAVVGAGVYADQGIAISCSGDGDVLLRHSVASNAACLYNYGNYTVDDALSKVIEQVSKEDQAQGAMIAIDRKGCVSIQSNSALFFVAQASKTQPPSVQILRKYENILPQHVICTDDSICVGVSRYPTTYGQLSIESVGLQGTDLFSLDRYSFLRLFRFARDQSKLLSNHFNVKRVAMVAGGNHTLQLMPLHGIDDSWKPITSEDVEFHSTFPGFINSKNGPKMSEEKLNQIHSNCTNFTKLNLPYNLAFNGKENDENLFAKIVRGELEQWRIWESNTHVAFLTPFANTPGFTVLVPRQHLSSDIFSLEENQYLQLVEAAKEVGGFLKKIFKTAHIGMIFEGFEIDYAHVKLIPCAGDYVSSSNLTDMFEKYPGFVTSQPGPRMPDETLVSLSTKLRQEFLSTISNSVKATESWKSPKLHYSEAIQSSWYRNVFNIQSTLYNETFKFFQGVLGYNFPLVPVTTDCISSPMGLGSDSLPVEIDLFGDKTYLADSMQFTLEYMLRLQTNLKGSWYIAPSFRGEDPDSTHLNQFYHVECELLGGVEDAIETAERYIYHITKAFRDQQHDVLMATAGGVDHVDQMIELLDSQGGKFKQITVDDAIDILPTNDCWEYAVEGDSSLGRKLTRKGERFLIKKFGGAVWLTEFDHLSCPFYQAYTDDTKQKAKCADLLLGLGETLGLGERHETLSQVEDALDHHEVPHEAYRWYLDMRDVQELVTSGWGMGIERYLCWLCQHDDVRDFGIFPRLKGWTIKKNAVESE